MKVTLYQAANDLAELLDQVDTETGEIPEGLEKAAISFQEKVRSISAYILEAEKKAGLLFERSKEMSLKAKMLEKRISWLKQYLIDNMQAANCKKVDAEDSSFTCSLALNRDKSVKITDESLLPQQYVKETLLVQADKKSLKADLEAGASIPGAELIINHRLTIF